MEDENAFSVFQQIEKYRIKTLLKMQATTFLF
jgi:hypothetical protein